MTVRDYVMERLDSWLNTALGFGGVTDKLRATRYSGNVRILADPELTAMYRTEHLSAKIVNVYPKEALREGFELAGYGADDAEDDGEDDTEEQVYNVLRQWCICDNVLRAAIWGRLYGGAKIWLGSYTADPATPFVMGEQIDFLRVIDKRYVQPRPWALDELGNPVMFDIIPEEGRAMVGPIHTSRLVHFPGQLTDTRTRINLGYWDDSVLQLPYEALQSDGVVWRSAQQLISEASIGVLKIKGLYQKLTGPARELLENRLAFFNATRSIARNMTLDYDGEEYKRENTTFAGVSDLTREGITRVASAAEIPVAILLSDEPSGLNATGDSSIRWWLMRVHAYRVATLEDPILYLCKAVLAQAGVGKVNVDKLAIKWPLLWTPSALEQADIRSKTSSADASDIEHGIVTSDEVRRSRFGKEGYSQETTIDRGGDAPTEAELKKAAAEGDPEGAGPTGPTGPSDPAGATGATGDAITVTDKPADKAMNGAQIAGIQDTVRAVAAQEIPRDSGVAIIKAALGEKVTAEEIMGSAGAGFTPKEPDPPPAPFGAEPGAPPPKGAEGDAPPKPDDEKPPPPAKE